jgi:hypothetical protein
MQELHNVSRRIDDLEPISFNDAKGRPGIFAINHSFNELKDKPGFRMHVDGFVIEEIFLDKINWLEGFAADDDRCR